MRFVVNELVFVCGNDVNIYIRVVFFGKLIFSTYVCDRCVCKVYCIRFSAGALIGQRDEKFVVLM